MPSLPAGDVEEVTRSWQLHKADRGSRCGHPANPGIKRCNGRKAELNTHRLRTKQSERVTERPLDQLA